MSDEQKLTREEQEEERRVKASVHRWMGVSATLLTVVAIIVAIYRLGATQTEVGLPLGEMMKIMFGALPWVLAVIAVGVLFSMGTTRIMLGLEKLVNLIRGKKKA